MQLLPGWLLRGAVATQFYLFGRQHFTQTGWLEASANYAVPDMLTEADLSAKVYIVTGATSGIGRKVTELLCDQGATVYMICRNGKKAVAVQDEIRAKGKGETHYLLADVGVAADVRRVAAEFMERESSLHGLVCNAGALLSERTLTSEDIEVTYATHLLHGSYLLTELLRQPLGRAKEPRVILVSSGGMYTTRWPGAEKAGSIGSFTDEYDGQSAYAIAKRGQVLLAEEWAKRENSSTSKSSHGSKISFVSAHPGWCATPGVEKVYGSARMLSPMRGLYEGAEGIAWLAAAPAEELETGAFYLDRKPQPKHMAGFPLDRSGAFTRNSDAEISTFMDDMAQQIRGNCVVDDDSIVK